MYYANYNDDGIITGFYNDLINSSIPESVIEITEEEWQEIINNQGKYKVDIETKRLVVVSKTLSQEIEPITDWAGFSLLIKEDVAYHRLRTKTTNQIDAIRLEIMAITAGATNQVNLTVLASFWNNMLTEVAPSDSLTVEEIERWNTIASSNNIPFYFSDNGQMILE